MDFQTLQVRERGRPRRRKQLFPTDACSHGCWSTRLFTSAPGFPHPPTPARQVSFVRTRTNLRREDPRGILNRNLFLAAAHAPASGGRQKLNETKLVSPWQKQGGARLWWRRTSFREHVRGRGKDKSEAQKATRRAPGFFRRSSETRGSLSQNRHARSRGAETPKRKDTPQPGQRAVGGNP